MVQAQTASTILKSDTIIPEIGLDLTMMYSTLSYELLSNCWRTFLLLQQRLIRRAHWIVFYPNSGTAMRTGGPVDIVVVFLPPPVDEVAVSQTDLGLPGCCRRQYVRRWAP